MIKKKWTPVHVLSPAQARLHEQWHGPAPVRACVHALAPSTPVSTYAFMWGARLSTQWHGPGRAGSRWRQFQEPRAGLAAVRRSVRAGPGRFQKFFYLNRPGPLNRNSGPVHTGWAGPVWPNKEGGKLFKKFKNLL